MKPRFLYSLRDGLKSIARRAPYFRDILAERDRLRAEVAELRNLSSQQAAGREFVPPGHFYSAIPSLAEVKERESTLFGRPPREIPGIELNEAHQLDLIRQWRSYYREQPFPREKAPERRYFFNNPAYSYGDALFLYCMLRHVRPRRIIEVGSGYSSCATLDTNEIFFDNSIQCTFIEPFPDLLRSLIKPADNQRISIIPSPVQAVPLSVFEQLEANDILFIDSTHVSKIGSDVNYLFFEVLPRIKPGVYVHVHDVFYPFEYPREWILEGRAWTEDYLLRAFLAFNCEFEIEFFATFLKETHEALLRAEMPLTLENIGGNIWLRRRMSRPDDRG